MTFTITEVMDAVKDAFARVGGETARDCVVEQTVKETLSARPGRKEASNETSGEIARRRKTTNNHNPVGQTLN